MEQRLSTCGLQSMVGGAVKRPFHRGRIKTTRKLIFTLPFIRVAKLITVMKKITTLGTVLKRLQH